MTPGHPSLSRYIKARDEERAKQDAAFKKYAEYAAKETKIKCLTCGRFLKTYNAYYNRCSYCAIVYRKEEVS